MNSCSNEFFKFWCCDCDEKLNSTSIKLILNKIITMVFRDRQFYPKRVIKKMGVLSDAGMEQNLL